MKNTGKKLIAFLMSAVMLFTALPLTALADGIDQTSDPISLEVNDPGYLEIKDGYVLVQVSTSNGGFYIGTEEGDKLTKSDDNKNLLYPDSNFDTSFTSFRVTRGGVTRDYVFGRDYTYMGLACEKVTVARSASNAITAKWAVDGLEFEQTIALMGADTNEHGMAYISYKVTEKSGAPVENVEARVMMDTALGYQDYAVYMLGQTDGSYTTVEREQTVSGKDYNNYFFAYDSKTAPTVTAYTVNASVDGEVIVPSKVTFAHWNNLAASVFDYEPSVDDPFNFTDPYNLDFMTADSAVALYYPMGNIEASGKGKSVGLYYGVYSNHEATDGKVVMNFISSGNMILNDDETAYKDLNGSLPGNFSSTIKLRNAGDEALSKVAIAIYPEDEVRPYDGDRVVNNVNLQNPFWKTVTDLRADETVDVRFDFKIDPTYVSDYRKIKIVAYDVSKQTEFTEENTLLTKEIYVLCPSSDNAEIGFTGMSPDTVFTSGRRFVYLTGSNFTLLRDKSQYRIILRPMDGGDDVVLDQDLVVIDPDRNAATLVLSQELRVGTWQVVIDWNDVGVEDLVSDALRMNVTDVPQPGDPGFVSAGIYGVVTVERSGNGTTEPYHYELVQYESEEAFKNTKTEQKNIMLVFRGDFNVLSSEEKGNFKAEALTLMEGDVITVNDALEVKNGRVTIAVNYNDSGKQTDISVDIDGDVRTASANTKVWNGICALTSIKEGGRYTLPLYSKDGNLGYFPGEETYDTITLIWPGAAGAAQTIVGLLIDLKYGEMALMKQGNEYARVIAFGAKLSPDMLVPHGTAATALKDSKMEKDLMSLGYSKYTATQLRSTYTANEREQREWRNSQVGTLNLYMDDILFGKGGFIGFNTTIEVGIPAYVDGMPYVRGTLALKIINDYWEFGVEGSADVMVFEMEAALYLKSYNGFPVPDKIAFHVGGMAPGIPVDPFGVFWIKGAGAGIDKMYESFFVTDRLPPLTLMLSGEFAIFNVLSARADVSLSMYGISAYMSNIGIGGVTIIDTLGGEVYWYPDLNIAFGIRVDIFDVLVGSGSIAVEYDYDENKLTFFQAYAKVTVKIPDRIFLIGGKKLGEASLGIDLKKVWCGVKVIGIGVAIIYYWGGDVDVKVGKKAKLPEPVMPLAEGLALYNDGDTGETLYMMMSNEIRLLGSTDMTVSVDDTVITSSKDKMSHSFTLDASANEDALLTASFPAASELAAIDLKNLVKVKVGGASYPLAWYDDNYDADHAVNIDTNALLDYDETTGIATVSVSFTDGAHFGKNIEISTPVSSELALYGIERLVDFDSLTLSDDHTKVVLEGADLARLSKLAINAQDENGAIYNLANVDTATITGDKVEIPLTYPQNLPTGSYKIQAVGTLLDSAGEYEIASPMIETDLEYTNAAQPKPIQSAKATLGGDYRVNVDLTAADSNYDGYVTTIYEVNADGELTATMFDNVYTELTDEEKAAGLNRSILLGGRYASTDSETGEVTYSGLEEGKSYVVSVQTYKNMEDGSRLLSTVTLTEKLLMTAPVKTTPVLSIENSVKATVGGTVVQIDTVASENVTVKVENVGNIRSGKYILGSGEAVEWKGGDIQLEGLEDGMYTLQLSGVNETGDGFATMYQFSVDTAAPAMLISSPQGGGFFEGDFVEVTGHTEAGAKIIGYADDGEKVTARADDDGSFSILIPVNYGMAYQDIKVYAQDALGNQSMPFGCTLTNHLMSDPDLKAVIMLNGEEITKLESTENVQQLTLALKSGDDYVTVNKGSAAEARIEWSTSMIEQYAEITDDGKLTGAPGAVGIVTVSLDNYSAIAEIYPTDLSTVRASLTLPQGGYTYDGTAKTPAVVVNDETLKVNEDYRIAYHSNTNAGVAVVTLEAIEGSKCTGVKILEFRILPRSIGDATMTLTQNGTLQPAVAVTLGGKTLVKGTDYTLTYLPNSDGIRGIAVVYGIGNYKNVLNQIFSLPTEPGTDPDTPGTSGPVEDTVVDSSDDMKEHSFTVASSEQYSAQIKIKFAASSAAEAEELKSTVTVLAGDTSIPLKWFDTDYADDHEVNKDANAKLSFAAGVATVTVILGSDDYYDVPITVRTEIASTVAVEKIDKITDEAPEDTDSGDAGSDSEKSTAPETPSDDEPRRTLNHAVWIIPTVAVTGIAVALYFVLVNKKKAAKAAPHPTVDAESQDGEAEPTEEKEEDGESDNTSSEE